MDLAIARAWQGRPTPRPHVGVALVKDGALVGEAHRHRANEGHPAVRAVLEAGAAAHGATLYATLEPGDDADGEACRAAVVAAKVARVVIAVRDPAAPGVAIAALRGAAIAVDEGVREEAAALVVAPWRKWREEGAPWVTLKLALSLDGRIATRTGESKWITGPAARAKGHALRARHDAIGVGVATVIADDCELTVRDAPGESPTRVVFDSSLRCPAGAKIVTTARITATVVVCAEDASAANARAIEASGAVVLRVARAASGRIDTRAALRAIAAHGLASLMIEGGAELAGSLLAGGFVDELHAFVAPVLLGPEGRPGAVAWGGPAALADAPRIASPTIEACGSDVYVHGRLAPPGAR